MGVSNVAETPIMLPFERILRDAAGSSYATNARYPVCCGLSASLRARRSNPPRGTKKERIASSLRSLAQTLRVCRRQWRRDTVSRSRGTERPRFAWTLSLPSRNEGAGNGFTAYAVFSPGDEFVLSPSLADQGW